MIPSPLTLLILLPFMGALLQGFPLGRVASRRIAISSSALCLGLSAWCLDDGGHCHRALHVECMAGEGADIGIRSCP